ncbi:MAG: lysylphosphatidylglycerol synthase transmembrane domain-containing protein [Ktedonobacteraceae bacterium]
MEALSTTALPAVSPAPRLSLWEDKLEHDPDASIPGDVFDVGSMSTMRLMQVSGMMRSVSLPLPAHDRGGTLPTVGVPLNPYEPQQRDALAVSHSYGSEVFGKTQLLPQVAALQGAAQEQAQPTWKTILNNSVVKTVLGLLIGIGMLFLISRFVDIPTTVSVLRQHLTTMQGGMFALLAAASFIAAFSLRGARWRLFLSRICEISTLKAIQVFWVAVFLNFLLPVQGGELAKSLILKRIKRVPISQSLPTVAMDKSLDLMPALLIMAAVPFIPGIHMSATLWIILSLVSGILLGIIFTVLLMAWNRVATTKFIQLVLKALPRAIGGKIEAFALGFIDSLLAGASSPKTFVPALLLTCLAVLCDGLFAWFAFLTVGVSNMSFGTAIFGYTTYVMFSILPNPPGQVGSNELVGVLVFGGLLGFPKTDVLAMFVFSHPLAALIMTTMSMLCLSALGISLTTAMKVTAPTGPKDDGSQATQQGVAVGSAVQKQSIASPH